MRDQAAINLKISLANRGRIPQNKNREMVPRIEYTQMCICGKAMKLFTTKANLDNRKFQKTCSPECYKALASKHGRTSAKSQSRRSKNEVLFANLCLKRFADVKCNDPQFKGWDADIILPIEKLAILWNGKWHYEKITEKHSLSQVQNRDRLKIKAIVECGFTPYVIKDIGKVDQHFVEEKFCELVNWLSRGPHKA